jgi:nucleotide-binding universal stress UspA family protein
MIRKLLVALDGSPRAAHVFHAAVELAEALGAALHLFRAVTVPPEFPPAGHVSCADELPAYLLGQAVAQLRAFAGQAPHLDIAQLVLESAQPWRAIIDTADRLEVDLIVVGSHGYHGVDHLLGTNAGRVANLAHRNVLVVHHQPDPPGVDADRPASDGHAPAPGCSR